VKSENNTLQEKLKQFEFTCRSKHIKITHQRREIFLLLASSNNHPSAEEIYKRIKIALPMISLDTVYRTLTTFEKAGIISRVQALDDRVRFDANLKLHHHLICSGCRRVVDFYWPAFDSIPLPPETDAWGTIKVKQVEIRGICTKCSKRRGSKH
jgi:Fur family peroxide stress response transcriptional regulator